jgi:hypothetical protein
MEKHEINYEFTLDEKRYKLIDGKGCCDCCFDSCQDICSEMPDCSDHEGHYIEIDTISFEEILEKYYNRRKSIENSFSWECDGSIQKSVENLTKEFAKLIRCKL